MKTSAIIACAIESVACACLAGSSQTIRDLPFPLTSVRLTGGPLQAQQEQNRKYLLRLEPDRLLSRFRSEAGLEPKAEPYGGWENPTLKRDKWVALPGHILAFWMSGAAMTVEATGDAELKNRLLYVVDELEAVQNAHGCGYALATKNGRKAYAEIARGDIRLPDRVVNGRRTNFGSVNGVFDLVYVLNKMLIGLCRTHEATGNEKAMRVFLRMSDWFGEEVVDRLDDAQVQKLLLGEHGSLPETYVWAWRRTGDEKYLRRARRLCHAKLLDPIIAGDADFLVGQHCNANIPKLFAALRVGDATGEPQFRKAAGDAWRKYALEHTVACGGNGCEECLFPASDFEKHLPHLAGAESCGSANMLRLTEALFETEPTAERMDYYERVLFDHLLGTHDPVLGRTVYHTPMRHATTRTYSSEFDSMWCCMGSGLETPAKYGLMVFTRASDDSSARVNLFAPATLDWSARGVKLRQETAFPYAETSCLKIEAVGANPEFAVKIRRPAWAGSGFSVSVNGERAAAAADSDGYVPVKRVWKTGDRLDVEFPMSLRAEYLPGSKNYAAFFYGPVLLVGDDGSEGISKQQYVSNPAACEGVERSYCSSSTFESRKAMPSVPLSAVENPGCCLERTACSPLTFRMSGTDVLLKPLFALHFSRYTTYWRVMGADEERDFAAAEAKAAEYAKRAVDGVSPGDYWSERLHSLAASHSETGVNIYGGPKSFGWRGAKGPAGKAFFSYRFAVGAEPSGRMLVARYRNCEKGARTFDVQVDGKTIFTESLKDGGRRGFIFREMSIPLELIAGKKEVEVRFVPKPGNIAGGLFGLWLVPDSAPVRQRRE